MFFAQLLITIIPDNDTHFVISAKVFFTEMLDYPDVKEYVNDKMS